MKINLRNISALKYNLLMLFFLGLTSCAHKVDFQISSVVPGARGYVQLKKDKNKNNVIDLHLSNLAEVERLSPAKKSYVVWMITDQNQTVNLGQINSSVSVFSKQLKATFQTVSTFVPIKIFITAEDDTNIQYPGNQLVISTDKFYN
jgi:hypothetical protein